MIPPLNPLLLATDPPAVMESRRWLEGVAFPPDRPLLSFAQAAPALPPPLALRQALAEALLTDSAAHLYGPVLGHPPLREALAARSREIYGGSITPGQVAITSGANQAFCAAITLLAGPGDEILLPMPWYFNHAMHCTISGVHARPLPSGPGLLPDPDHAAALIGPRSRAIVLVSPNNPGGVAYPPDLIAAFRDLCRARGLALVLDETYRDFHPGDGPPHPLFLDPDWDGTLIQLYSFSKSFRLTGHRVGALLASPARLAQVEKYLDTVSICPGQPGQRAALWGLQHLTGWLAGERAEVLARAEAVRAGFAALPGWHLQGCGAYFAWVRHPFALPAPELCRHLVREAGLLLLPGTMFRPAGDPDAPHELRIAFANADRAGITQLFARLSGLDLPLAG